MPVALKKGTDMIAMINDIRPQARTCPSRIHRVLVLRAMPRLRFDVVALGTGLAADECGGCYRTRRQHAARRVVRTEGQELKCQTYCDGRCA